MRMLSLRVQRTKSSLKLHLASIGETVRRQDIAAALRILKKVREPRIHVLGIIIIIIGIRRSG